MGGSLVVMLSVLPCRRIEEADSVLSIPKSVRMLNCSLEDESGLD